VSLPKISVGQRLENIGGSAKNFVSKGKGWLQTASAGWQSSARQVKSTVNPKNFKQMPPQKKFFLASLAVLLLAVIFSIGVAVHLKNSGKIHAQISGQLKNVQSFLANAQSSLLYKDGAAAAGYLQQAKASMPQKNSIDSADKQLYSQLLGQLSQTETEMQNIFNPQVVNLGSVGSGSSLIKLPNYIGTQSHGAIISYNAQSGAIQDSAISSPLAILGSAYLSGTTAAVYDGSSLYMWDFSTGKTGAGFSQNVPQTSNFGGMAEYPTNSRVYMIDKKSASIISFLAGKNSFSKPITSVTDPSLNSAIDIAIDGSIYVLTPAGISKFQNGKLTDFSISALAEPFSGSGKIATDKTFTYIYVLDSGNNQILILDKSGNLVNTLKSSEFTNLKDFTVDEKNKVMYVLNDGNLLKVTLP
jgi:hypothetical protein